MPTFTPNDTGNKRFFNVTNANVAVIGQFDIHAYTTAVTLATMITNFNSNSVKLYVRTDFREEWTVSDNTVNSLANILDGIFYLNGDETKKRHYIKDIYIKHSVMVASLPDYTDHYKAIS